MLSFVLFHVDSEGESNKELEKQSMSLSPFFSFPPLVEGLQGYAEKKKIVSVI